VKLNSALKNTDTHLLTDKEIHHKHTYFHVKHNINKTHNIKCYNSMVLGYVSAALRPSSGQLVQMYWRWPQCSRNM